MSGWRAHTGVACVLDMESVDTDQLIPARFMSTPRAEGYGQFLLHDMRRDAEGDVLDGFPLNEHPRASILVTRRNFGSGSSREAAVYALVDAGFRVVLAPSFGDIFASNAVNNGLLPARVPDATVDAIIARLGHRAGPSQIDLDRSGGHVAGVPIQFDLDPVWREKLINGWDDIDLTRQHDSAIQSFGATRHDSRPWTVPDTRHP